MQENCHSSAGPGKAGHTILLAKRVLRPILYGFEKSDSVSVSRQKNESD